MDRIIPPKMTSPKIHHDAKFDLDPQVIDDKKLRAELLLEELFHIIIHADTRSNYSNYEFYMEAIKLLLILFSTQTQKLALVSNKPGTNYFLDIVFNRLQHLSPHIVLRLMQNFNEQLPTPANGGIISNAYSYLFTTISTALTTLSRNGLLLLSILVHQSTLAKNNFRTVLASIVDSSNTDANKVKVKFKVLHDLIAYNLHVPEACILLYLMVTQNPGFKNYLLSRTDLDLLILPILKIINDISIDSDFNQIYVLTTVLLIISQDDFYMEQTHKVTVNAPIWYIDRVIKTTSVGGLIILILLKTISINLSSLNDLFLHELLLATLTNFSSKINGFHPQSFSVANKFIVLLETATKKMVKLDKEDVEFDIYQDVVYEILQVFNNVITRSVQKNPQLVYALLHKKELFDTFNSFPKLTVFSSNIQVIVKLFNDWILEQEIETSDDVLDFIRDISRVTFEGLVHVDAVKFGFQEEDGYHLFFLPFVWSIGFSI